MNKQPARRGSNTMNATTKTLLGLTMMAVLAIGGWSAAHADGGAVERDYADAMWYFVPVIGTWSADVERTAQAVQVKPELASRLDELSQRGTSMLFDLEGTPVPEELRDTHELLLAGLRQYIEVTQIAAEDASGARLMLTTYEPLLDGARGQLRNWLMARLSIGSPSPGGVLLVDGS